MEKTLLTIFTRTPLHVGAGSSVGAVDLPIVRERHTRFPVIPGTSLKGVLRDLWLADSDASDRLWLFGNEQGEKDKDKFAAGALLIGEARPLAFPVRSAKGGFAWVTCPLALARYKRDAGLSALAVPPAAAENECLAGSAVQYPKDAQVVLEEYCFKARGPVPAEVTNALRALVDDAVWHAVDQRLVILTDELFSYFVENACEVVTRVRINDETGTVDSGALFNQEQVPSETLFYAVIAAQSEKGKKAEGQKRDACAALKQLRARLESPQVGNVLQIGGDETTGLGWCSVKLIAREA